MSNGHSEKKKEHALNDIVSLSNVMHEHYVLVENAVEHASLDEIYQYAAKIHGMDFPDQCNPKSPMFSPQCHDECYQPDACYELKNAIAMNILGGKNDRLAHLFVKFTADLHDNSQSTTIPSALDVDARTCVVLH